MSIAAVLKYRAVQTATCTPGQLLVMLYDGIFRFLGEAKAAMDADDRARTGNRIDKALAIIEHLAATLDPQAYPELAETLEPLYLYCMNTLVQANLHRDKARIEQVEGLLLPLRDAWKVAVQESSGAPAATGTDR